MTQTKDCLYHPVMGDAVMFRYRFHAVLPDPIPGEPPGINLSNKEWWQYILLNERFWVPAGSQRILKLEG